MSGLDNMKKRLDWAGGDTQDGRNVKGKLLSLRSAIKNSYQAEWITFNGQRFRCLINPSKIIEEYDQKEISIEFVSGIKDGSTFYWDRTESYWICFLRDFSEEAYFRSNIRRCLYKININNVDYPVYVRGPVETALVWSQKHKITFNDMNHSLLLYITKNKDTLEYLSRHQIIDFPDPVNDFEEDVENYKTHKWKVAATDKYSQAGLIEVYLEEYFDNSSESLIIDDTPEKPDTSKPYIEGPQIIKPYDTKIEYIFSDSTSTGTFVVNSSKVKITKQLDNKCYLDVLTGKENKFKIDYVVDDEVITSLDVNINSI